MKTCKKIFNNFRKGRSSIILLLTFLLISLGPINCAKDKSSGNEIPPPSTVEAPAFSPAAGTYNTDQSVTISTITEGALIYYTTDGSAPTSSSTEYTAAISVAGHGTTMTIKAIAIKSGMSDSSVAEATYTINYDQVGAPTFNPNGGTFSSAQSVTISTTTEGASIKYTIDRSKPSSTVGTVYSAPVTVSGTTVINAIAYLSGMTDSTVATATFNFLPVVYAATRGGLSISNTGGGAGSFVNRTTADGLGSDNVSGVYVVGSDVYASTWAGLGISNTGGTSFNDRTTADGLGNNWLYGVYVVGSNVYVATSGGLSISDTGGAAGSFVNRTTTDGLGNDDVLGGVYVVIP